MSSFGFDSPARLKSTKTKKESDMDIDPVDAILDKNLPPKQFSIFDHSNTQVIKNNKYWVQVDQD